jgi:hypothetical protein
MRGGRKEKSTGKDGEPVKYILQARIEDLA